MRAGGGGGTGDAICRDGSPAPSLYGRYRQGTYCDLPTLASELLAEHVTERGAPALLVAHVLAVVLALVQRGLHRERNLALVRVHVDDLHVELVAFLHHVARVLHADEDAEVGDVANLAADDRPDRILLLEQRPGIRLDLLHAQRDALRLRIDVQHHGVHLVADGHDLRRVLDPLRPAHLADVDQALDPGLHLDEGAVVGEADDLARDARARRILLRGVRPGVLLDLLQTEADALGGRIELEHDHAQLVADVEHLARVPDAAPAHVGDVQEAVDAAQVDEGAVVGQVLHDAGEDGALLQLLEGVLLQRLPLLLQQDAPAEHDVAALLVELDHLELELLADQLAATADRPQVHLRPGVERLHPHADREPALHAPDDGPLAEVVSLARGGDLVPDAHLVGLLLGEDDHARVVLARLEQHLHRIAHLHVGLAADEPELLDGNLALALVPDVHHCVVLGELDHAAADDLVLLQLAALRGALALEGLFEHGGEIFFAADQITLRIRHVKVCLRFFSRRPLKKEAPLATGSDGKRRKTGLRLKAPADPTERPGWCQGCPEIRCFRRCDASRKQRSTTCSRSNPVVSTTTASAAARSGAMARSVSSLSRRRWSARTSGSGTDRPFSASSAWRRCALASSEAVRKNFTSASGKTTVPMSRPSNTAPRGAARPRSRCSWSSFCRTTGRAETTLAPRLISGVRIASVTSSPRSRTRSPRNVSPRPASRRRARPGSSSQETPARCAANATER